MEADVELRSAAGRWLLAAVVLASGMAFLDTTVVNVALPAIGDDLGAAVGGLQWVLNGYLVTLASLILLGGALGDRFGRRRMLLIGVVGFAAASALCAAAPTVPLLVGARMVQGAAGALLVPGSLAIVEASFHRPDRPAAIGAWSGLAGITTAVGPVLGGWLVDAASWRWIFLLNVPLAAIVVALTIRHVPESRNPEPRPFDPWGAALATAGLGGGTWALIAAGERGAGSAPVVATGVVAAATLALFVLVQHRSPHPMLPLSMFSSRQFTAANLVTVAVYAALGAVFFLLVVHLQQVLGYSALDAGLASVPITVLMLVLSAPSGELAQRIGPRTQMTVGPFVAAAGVALMVRIDAGDSYLSSVLPAVVVLGLGLATTVAPLTASVLGAVDDRRAGVASGVNNATARTAQLAAVAVVPVLAGLTGDAYLDPAEFAAGFRNAMWITAGVAAAGGIIGFLTVRNPLADDEPATPPRPRYHCAMDAPALERGPSAATGG